MEKLYTHCLRCGRKLKTDESKRKGYGLICEKKAKKQSKLKLF